MAQFGFLKPEWPALHEAATRAAAPVNSAFPGREPDFSLTAAPIRGIE